MRSILLLTALTFALPAHADLTLEYDDGAGQRALTFAIKDSRLRLDVHGSDAATMLFDGARREITVLDPSARSYMVFDRALMQSLKQQMEQAMQMMQQMGLDPEAMGMTGPGEMREIATGEKRTVGGWPCEVYRVEVDGKVDSVTCVTQPADLGISGAEFSTMQSMFEMLEDMAADIMPAGFGSAETAPVDGVMVESETVGGGGRQRLTRISDAAVDAARFEVPSGWKRQQMDMPGMPGG